ncbi:MAG: hypothetical protein HY791_11275 [Deltaproteobacteria bacterium]|nr:hypothetical protein [Deltaproteobacteria bacterium]
MSRAPLAKMSSGKFAISSGKFTIAFAIAALTTSNAAAKEFFVDPARGSDSSEGSESRPFKSLERATTELGPGVTLTLRGGVHRGALHVAARGRADAPIVVRGFPNEKAIIDSGLAEFFDQPAQAWTAHEGAFRSTHRYFGLRQVTGSFVDGVGLVPYEHFADFSAKNELVVWPACSVSDQKCRQKSDHSPVYLGPGLFYEVDTGYIRARLDPTHHGLANSSEPTDPRATPLVLAPLRARALHVDGAAFVQLRDLELRGGGLETARLEQSSDITFDGVVVKAGTYGVRVVGVQRLTVTRSWFVGNCPPWLYRSDTRKRDYPGKNQRNLTKLNTHALLVLEGESEASVYATPTNDEIEISKSSFTDSHDGVYLGGASARFFENRIENMVDDAIYLSPMFFRDGFVGAPGAVIEVFSNLIVRSTIAFAFGGSIPSSDRISIYRNVVDQRSELPYVRPEQPPRPPSPMRGRIFGDHGSPDWPELAIYQNTFVTRGPLRPPPLAQAQLGRKSPKPRLVLNNLFIDVGGAKRGSSGGDAGATVAGNFECLGSDCDRILARKLGLDSVLEVSPRPDLRAESPVPLNLPDTSRSGVPGALAPGQKSPTYGPS